MTANRLLVATLLLAHAAMAGHNPPLTTEPACQPPPTDTGEQPCDNGTCGTPPFAPNDSNSGNPSPSKDAHGAVVNLDTESKVFLRIPLDSQGLPGRLSPGWIKMSAQIISPETFRPGSLRITSQIDGVRTQSDGSIAVPTTCCDVQVFGGAGRVSGSILLPAGTNPGATTRIQKLDASGNPTAGTAAAGFAVTASAAGRAALDLPAGGRLMGKTICLLRKPESRGDVVVRGCFF